MNITGILLEPLPIPKQKIHTNTGLSDEFARDVSRQALWAAFLKKSNLGAVMLGGVMTALRDTLQPALVQAALLDGV